MITPDGNRNGNNENRPSKVSSNPLADWLVKNDFPVTDENLDAVRHFGNQDDEYSEDYSDPKPYPVLS
jgi:hypothetical protein